MGRSRIVSIICKRDKCTTAEAIQLIEQAIVEMEACGYDSEECEDIMMSVLGLEMDYIFDVIV